MMASSPADDSEEALASYCQYFQTSLAMAIIRSKPTHFKTAKEYAEQLADQLWLSSDKESTSIQSLKEEILVLKQQILMKDSCETSQLPSDDSGLQQSMTSASSQLPLTFTPALSGHNAFLHNIFKLQQLSKCTTLNAEQQQIVVSTTESTLTVIMTEMDKYDMKMSAQTVFVIAKLSDFDFTPENSSKMKKTVVKFVHSLICTIITSNKANSQLCDLILNLCESSTYVSTFSLMMASCIYECSEHLRQVRLHGSKLAAKKIENSYYIMRCLEYIISTERNKSAFTEEKIKELALKLESSMSHIGQSFPLFSHYLWRLHGLAQCLNVKCVS